MADIVNQILLNVEAGDASTKIGDIKRAIKELEGVALASGDANSDAFKKATQAAGKLRDSLEDVKDATKTFKGDPLEGLSKGLGSLKGRLTDLDFQGFNDEVGRLKTLSKQVSFKELSSSVGETGKSFLSLGKILLTNPIFLIATIVTTIITNFDKLASAGGKIGLVFTAIGDTINFVIDKLKAVSDFLGLTDFQGQEKAKNTLENADKEKKAIEARYDREIQVAQAAGEDVTALELKKQEEIRANAQLQIDQLNYLAQSQGTLTKEQQDNLDDLNQQYQDSLTETAVITAGAQKKAADKVEADAKEASDRAKAAREKRKAALEKSQDEELAKVQKNLDDELEARKQFYDQELTDLIAAKTAQGDFSAEADKEIADKAKENNLKLLQDSLATLEQERIEISNNKKLSNEDRINLEEELADKILETRNQIAVGIRDIEKTNAAELQKDVQEAYAGIAAGITQEQSKEVLELTNSTNQQLTALNEQYRNGEIKSLEDYEKEKSKIIEDEEDKRRQIELESAQKRLTNIENEAKNALALLPEGSQEFKDAKAKYDSDRIAAEQAVSDKLREINQDYTNDAIAEEQRLADEREKNRQAILKINEDTFNSISALISQTSVGFENLGSDILQAASNIGGQITATIATFTDKNATASDKLIAGFQAASSAIGEIGNIFSQQSQRRLDEIAAVEQAELDSAEKTKDAQIAAIEEQVQSGVLTKEEGDKKKAESEFAFQLAQFNANEKARKAEFDAKKKTFEQEKKIRIASAVAQGAAAAIAAYSSGVAVPVIGPATGAAYAAIAAAFTAAQVALISSQKFEGSFTPGTAPTPPSNVPGAPGGGGGGNQNTFSPPQFFGLGQGIFQSQAAGNQTQQVVVLESDITNVQNRVRVIEDRATIG